MNRKVMKNKKLTSEVEFDGKEKAIERKNGINGRISSAVNAVSLPRKLPSLMAW